MFPRPFTGGSCKPELAAAIVTILFAVPASAGLAQGSAAELPAELKAVRTSLEKYQDPIVAVHDGYLSTLGCIEYPEGASHGTMSYAAGGKGVHFLNLQLIGPTLDPAKPQVLIYEPHGDKLRLVAAEWFVPVEVAGSARPSVLVRRSPRGLGIDMHERGIRRICTGDVASTAFRSSNRSIR